MALKSHLYYDIGKDKGLGFRHRRLAIIKPCSSAIILLIRGIYKNWKQPISYLLSRTSCTPEILQSILFQCIRKLKEMFNSLCSCL